MIESVFKSPPEVSDRSKINTVQNSSMLGDLATALSKAQRVLTHPKRTHPGHKYKYADLAEVLNTIRGPLTANDLSLVQLLGPTIESYAQVTTILMHKSGQFIQSTCQIPIPKNAMANACQNYGTAVTYARRYGIAAMVGLYQEDDTDGDPGDPGDNPGGQSENPDPTSDTTQNFNYHDNKGKKFDATKLKGNITPDQLGALERFMNDTKKINPVDFLNYIEQKFQKKDLKELSKSEASILIGRSKEYGPKFTVFTDEIVKASEFIEL